MSTNQRFHLLRALRPKQWTKNAVVFAAFVFALGDQQQGISITSFWEVLRAAILFCMTSSGIYLLNDVRDLEYDRNHPTKKHRPIAAGRVPVSTAIVVGIGLIGASTLGAWVTVPALGGVLFAYVMMQIAYTFGLKKIALVDSFVIASGFVLRALAGAVAIRVAISPWLLICTLLLALFLALCKRRHEKVVLSNLEGATRPALDQYNERLLDQLIAIVSAATLVSYALYTLWPDTVEKFGTTHLGFTIPFVIFGLFRYLDLVYRHEKGGRPEQILLTDAPLLINLFLYGVTVLVVILTARV